MIKVTYYIGTNDKDTLKPKLCKSDFVKLFDKVFKDYTLTEAIGRFTNINDVITEELSLIVTTFIEVHTVEELKQLILYNFGILKEALNQESILVEVAKPEAMFL